MIKEDIVFFIGRINFIGGVETWIYEIAKKYAKNRNIVLLYKSTASQRQMFRLEKLIKCIKYTGQEIECNKLIVCYDHSIIKTTKAKEYILTIHADYKVQNLRIEIPKEINTVYAVSKTAQEAFIETHKEQLNSMGLKCEVLYNPITVDKPKKVLRLVSATRLTPEKGAKRMNALAKRLSDRNIPFVWLVFCANGTIELDIDGFIKMNPVMNITDYIADADYLVQLSDTEGYAYTLVEALCLGTPLIVTEIPICKEMGIIEGLNACILKFDLSNMEEVIDNALKYNLKGFKYNKKESNDEYLKILGEETNSNYKPEEKKLVKAIVKYNDIVENKIMEANKDEFLATPERALFLQEKGYVEIKGM